MTRTKGLSYYGLGGLKQPFERCPEVSGGRVNARVEISFDIVNGALQHVDLVAQRVELLACHDELVFAEAEFIGALPGDPVPLTASLRAKPARSPHAVAGWQRGAAPLTPWSLCSP